MNKMNKIISLSVTFALVFGMFILPARPVYADDHFLHDETVTLSNGNTYTIHALDEGYDNNVYLSLRDMAAVLSGTEAAFNVSVIDGEIAVLLGQNGDADRSPGGWTEDEKAAYYSKSLQMNNLTVDTNVKKYYTIRAAYGSGTDCFISMLSLAMMLNINIYTIGDNSIAVDPGSSLAINPENLESEGFFLEADSVLVGDATTGQILYEYRGDEPLPIASTTKLMTCLLAEEAISAGTITEDTMVTVTEEAERISKSADGTVPMTAGNQATVKELMIGALLPSSNECALLLGDAIAGSEEAFVQMMNDKAAEISMSTAVFYNTNGLPSYGTSGIPGKRQNTMTAEDMFRMCSYILNNYPQMKDITSMTIASLPNLGKDVANTNGLLYNMPEINGLKTGTTDKAGACLITSLTVNDGTMNHDIVVVELGAEGSKARLTISELMARYGKKVILGEENANGVTIGNSEGDGNEIDNTVKKAITAQALVKMVVNGAFKLNKAE